MRPVGVSVVIVNWNTRDLVLRALESLCAAGGEADLELIVVDNGSGDASVEAIARAFPEVTIVALNENRGFAGGVNRGLDAATRPLVLLLNSDARASRASVDTAARYMEGHPHVGILGSRVVNIDGKFQPNAWRDPSLKWLILETLGLAKLKPLDFEHYRRERLAEPREVDCVSGCAMMIRRDLLQELGGFDEDFFMYFEDTDLCVRARGLGTRVHQAPVGEFIHDAGGASKVARLRTFLDFRRSQILFHRKHGGVAAALAARGLLALSSALRLLPLVALSLFGRSEQARERLRLHWSGLVWLINPFTGLVPDVDRSSEVFTRRSDGRT